MPTPFTGSAGQHSPFLPANTAAYTAWRDGKLSRYPDRLEDLLVEVGNPLQLTPAELQALRAGCDRANMALYASSRGEMGNRAIPIAVGRQLGLRRMDHNYLSDDDGLTSLTVAAEGTRSGFIPYTNRPIKWHTDGYYNGRNGQIHGLLLHCAASAASGGENALLDHEIAYILLREQNPDFIHALMDPEVMSIPARMEDDKVARHDQPGPVFSIDLADGRLHMRYTARSRNVHWKQDALTQAAVSALDTLLNSPSPYIFRGRLESGMGLVSNNVLHDRSGFDDDPENPRLLYRARYYDRIPDTSCRDSSASDTAA